MVNLKTMKSGVLIDSGPIKATFELREVPPDKWDFLMRERRDYLRTNLSYDCSNLVRFIDDAKEMYQVLGFASAEAMVRDGYKLAPTEIGAAVQWLRTNPAYCDRPLDEVLKLARHGGDRRSKQAKDQDRIPILKTRGKDYDVARLNRDHPDLASRVRSGELSANAAAIEAGFRRKLTPYEQVLKLIPKLSQDERRQLKEMLS